MLQPITKIVSYRHYDLAYVVHKQLRREYDRFYNEILLEMSAAASLNFTKFRAIDASDSCIPLWFSKDG